MYRFSFNKKKKGIKKMLSIAYLEKEKITYFTEVVDLTTGEIWVSYFDKELNFKYEPLNHFLRKWDRDYHQALNRSIDNLYKNQKRKP